MQYRILGKTGIRVSTIAFGAGPISGLMTGDDMAQQIQVVRRAIQRGVNWFDTAATYGEGRSEANLGAVLAELDAADQVHLATKCRFLPEDLRDVAGHARRCLEASLDRLGVQRVALLQLHNSITPRRGDEPTSVTPRDVLGAEIVSDPRSGPTGDPHSGPMNAPTSGGDRLAGGSIFAAFDQLRREGLVQHLGLTGIGHPAALHEVIDSGRFATVQTPYSLLNPSAGQKVGAHFAEHDYGNLIAACQRHGMGVFAIRVFAAGALLGHAPSAHTVRTKFFPLDLYRRDARRGKQLEARLRLQRHDLNSGHDLTSTALRFVLSHPGISSAIVGLGAEEHVDVAAGASDAGPLEASMLEPLTQWATSPAEDPGESHDG